VFSTRHCVTSAEVTPALGILDLVQMIIALGFIIWSRPEDAGAYQNDPKWRYVKMIENGRHSNNEEFTETVEHWKPRKTFEPEK
jgi:hypothetical protein